MKFFSTVNTLDIKHCPFCGMKFTKSHQWNQWNRHVHIEADHRRVKRNNNDPEWEAENGSRRENDSSLRGGHECKNFKRKFDDDDDDGELWLFSFLKLI